jgi:CheY-like chemotaxis protein
MLFEDFRKELHTALNHLYDPDYEPTPIAYLGAGCDLGESVAALQERITRAIEDLRPEPGAPADSRPRRDFEVLHYRFVVKLSQEQTAARMGRSVRSIQRAQREATHLLARRLWEQQPPEGAAEELLPTAPLSPGLAEWHSQVRQELVALQRSVGPTGVDLWEATHGALRIARASLEDRGIHLEAAGEETDARVRYHPSVLHQILLDGIQALAQSVSSGVISLSIQRQRERVRLAIVGRPAEARGPIDAPLARELLSALGGTIESSFDDDSVLIVVELSTVPSSVGQATVLLVDDNPDLVTVFEAYCTGTRYRIVPVRGGQQVQEAIREHSPDVILLDVMLPDVDGWDLLLELQTDPATKSLPVIVCSVVVTENLALALGAALYLPKPVYREQLISALDRVLSQAGADA